MEESQHETGSTYHTVITLTRSQEELLTRLHRSVLDEELELARPHWHGDIAVALSNILFELLSSLEGDHSLEVWAATVREARPFRDRLAQEARRQQQAERRAARPCHLPEFLELFGSAPEVVESYRGHTGEEHIEEQSLCWADLPESVTRSIESYLREVRECLVSQARAVLEKASTTKTRRRRLDILEVLGEHLLSASPRGFLADQLNTLLGDISAREVASRLAGPALKKITPRTLENEVSRIKSELKRLKAWLATSEQDLRLEHGLAWVGQLALEREGGAQSDSST